MECNLTVLCENSVAVPHGLMGEHGWAIHVDTGEHRLLLDTGQGLGLLNNSRVLGVDLSRVDAIVVSHGHYDHTTGLPDALTACGGTDVYIHPDAFVDRYWFKDGQCREIGIRYKQGYLESIGARFKPVTEFTEIFPRVYLTGEVPKTSDFEPPDANMKLPAADSAWVQDELKDDLSLVVDTDKGLTVVLGCAHAGLINITDLRRPLLFCRRRNPLGVLTTLFPGKPGQAIRCAIGPGSFRRSGTPPAVADAVRRADVEHPSRGNSAD